MATHDTNPGHGQSENPFESGLGILFLAAFPMILLLFQGSATSAFAAVLQIAIFVLALRLIHRGRQIHREYDAAVVAKAPKLPRKIAGSALIGLMVMILAGHQFASLLAPFGFGLVAATLALLAFGTDPMRDKGQADPESLRRDKRDAALDKIEAAMEHSVHDIAELGDADLTRQVEGLKSAAMGLLRALSSDGTEAKRLRKPAAKFIELLGRENERLIEAWETDDQFHARRRYLARIAALGQAFEDRARKTGAREGRDAYELEADLLWNRMSREGKESRKAA